MKKLIFTLIALLLFIAACNSDNDKPETSVEPTTNEPTQEELNEQLKEEAIEADIIQINGDEVEEGTKLKATGEISVYKEGLGPLGKDFMLTTEEGNGHGIYQIINMDANDTTIQEEQTVTVYGTYYGKDESGTPQITVTVIE